MTKLDDLIRRSHAKEPPPAHPPVGQWAGIQEALRKGREGVPPPPHPGGWKFGGGLLMGLLIGLTLGAGLMYGVRPRADAQLCESFPLPERTQPLPIRMNSPVRQLEPPRLTGEELVAVDLTSPPTTEAGVVKFKVPTAYGLDLVGTPQGAARLANRDRVAPPPLEVATSVRAFERPSIQLPQSVNPQSDPTRPSLAVQVLPAGSEITPLPIKRRYRIALPSVQLPSIVLTKLADEQNPLTKNKHTFKRLPLGERPRGRWEVGASGLLFDFRTQFVTRRYQREPESPGEQLFDVATDAGTAQLYRATRTDYQSASTSLPNQRIGYLEIARQFPSGVRAAVGILRSSDEQQVPTRVDFRDEVLAGAPFGSASVRAYREIMLGLAVQYTFRKRRRFRISPGIAVLASVDVREQQREYFYEANSEGSVGSLITTTWRENFLSYWVPAPSLNLQYQLTRRLALSGDLLPGIGLGARYQFNDR